MPAESHAHTGANAAPPAAPMQTCPDNSPMENVTAHPGAHLSINKIVLPPSVERLAAWFLPMMIAMTLVIGACGVVMGLNLATQHQEDNDFKLAQTHALLLERRYMDIEAYAILNGWKVPGDDAHGPTGNMQRMKPKR